MPMTSNVHPVISTAAQSRTPAALHGFPPRSDSWGHEMSPGAAAPEGDSRWASGTDQIRFLQPQVDAGIQFEQVFVRMEAQGHGKVSYQTVCD